jgi:hypothetical protein
MSNVLENKAIGTDLCNLALLLNKHGLCNNTSPLDSAGNNCINTATADTWQYKLEKLVFFIDEVGGRMAADSTDLTVSLSIDIVGSTNTTSTIINPLEKLQIDIELDGSRLNPRSYQVENLYSSWHLDRHIFGKNDAKTKYSHPLYHFTFGGRKMEEKGHDAYGSALILPSPRLLYPPMDAAIGIDFIIQNYIHKDKVGTLLEQPEYIQIIRSSQQRIWHPFFCSLYSFWDSTPNLTTHPDFSPLKLLPLYY